MRTLEYDPLQRPTHIHVQAIGPGTAESPSGPIQLDWRLAYDPAGNLIQRDTRDGPYSYAYDPLDRLIEVVPPASVPELPLEGYQYDGVGNRTQSAHQPGVWGYDPDNRLTQYGEGPTLTALTHSPNGQRSELITPNHRTRYHYDAADRLTTIERDGQEQARYQYDPFGRRISKTVAGITTWYLYTDEGLIAELDATGTITRAYGWEPDSAYGTKPLWQAEIQGSNWQFHFLHPDHLGTPQLATDAQGNISWQARSEAFGRTFPAPSNSITMNLRFPGQYYDQESGLHYNYYRDYDPETGRYVEGDPVGLREGVNTYGYAAGNPLDTTDHLGLLVIGKGCEGKKEDQILKAESQLRKMLEANCCEFDCSYKCSTSSGCVPCIYVERLRQALDRVIVTCLPIRPGACASGGEGTGLINIEDVGFLLQGVNKCGCLSSQIYHELFHDIDLDEGAHFLIEAYTIRCFPGCARRHDPSKYPDYGW